MMAENVLGDIESISRAMEEITVIWTDSSEQLLGVDSDRCSIAI
jgi:hypothetical protein